MLIKDKFSRSNIESSYKIHTTRQAVAQKRRRKRKKKKMSLKEEEEKKQQRANLTCSEKKTLVDSLAD